MIRRGRLAAAAAAACLIGSAAGAKAETLAGIAARLPATHAVIVERAGKRLLADGALSPRWRWASVTKQVVAVLVMQEVAAGRIALDMPIALYLPGFGAPNAGTITVRQLLRHQSGLPNPDDVPASAAAPSGFYSAAATGDPLGYCAGPAKAAPGGNWEYNNCDYIVAGALLERVTGKPWARLVTERIARPLGLASLSTAAPTMPAARLLTGGKPENVAAPDLSGARFGAAASLAGSPGDLARFDRALLAGRLLPAAARADLWDGQPRLGAIALGQWAFTAPLAGCKAPVRVIERRGAVGGTQVRNFILPEQGVVVVVFAGDDAFDFGEVWQGKGFSHDLLAKAAC